MLDCLCLTTEMLEISPLFTISEQSVEYISAVKFTQSHELSGLTVFQGSGSVTVDMLSFIHRADARTDRGWRVFQPVKCASAAFVYYAHKVQPYMRGQEAPCENKMAMQSFGQEKHK